ncbi:MULTISPECIES: hypothetical protein [Xanthomonas]|uniref:hypothetical protein n=1 Tax=Xanthomonas TaxID=338 RepID=UPI00128FDF8C|nr:MULTISPECIES: hypothetical protein [Xanthomonas]
MSNRTITQSSLSGRSSVGPHTPHQRGKGWRNTIIGLSAGILLTSQTASATMQWNANANMGVNQWITNMYNNIPEPLRGTLDTCSNTAAAANCQVRVMANAGVHTSASDDQQHFTIRFAGNAAPYSACHVYPQEPANRNNPNVAEANCFNGGAVDHFDF